MSHPVYYDKQFNEMKRRRGGGAGQEKPRGHILPVTGDPRTSGTPASGPRAFPSPLDSQGSVPVPPGPPGPWVSVTSMCSQRPGGYPCGALRQAALGSPPPRLGSPAVPSEGLTHSPDSDTPRAHPSTQTHPSPFAASTPSLHLSLASAGRHGGSGAAPSSRQASEPSCSPPINCSSSRSQHLGKQAWLGT